MRDYVMAGLLLTAVDQQLSPDRKALLPAGRWRVTSSRFSIYADHG